ncbi:Phosphate transport system regulatory protein PhoU [hydrothermal vent metagenome]|uniref:Phosphate transport system regulatory protein PhoU n=1 Tax=hydrothermal vent metagenome TaxID=652676 RepID=A0A1W1D3F4_9ZZZZ
MVSTKFQESLEEIQNKVINVGEGLVKANELLVDAIEQCDTQKFEESKAQIKNISSKTDSIDNDIIKVLALYTPEARDLRTVIAYLKITNELARASSNTRSFIRGFTKVCKDVDTETINEYALPMQRATLNAIKTSMAMFEVDDEDEIREVYNEVLIEENKTEDLYEMVERNLLTQANQANNFEKYHKMLKALRKGSKIASRAISIANLLVYAKVGGNFHN